MAKTLQHRRNTTAGLSGVTGSVGEIFIDTTKNTVVVMDGSTAGGFPLELEGAGTGATGPTGATGVTGASGTQGVNGASGSNGTNGATGTAGVDGATGVAGVNGATGSQGIQGASGSTGLDGATGSQGIQGASGVTGATGVKGEQGNFGGAAFDYLYDTSSTADSDPGTGYFKFDSVTLSSVAYLYINETDYLSATATSFLETIDDSTSNIKGHFSMAKKSDPTKYTLFAITGTHTKSGSYYKVPVSYLSGDTTHADEEENILTFQRTGDKGDTGLTGATGIQGASGSTGLTGATGIAGATGAAGSNGATGSQGIQGASGSTGLTGATGIAGATGAAGSNGTNGATGATGPQGIAGVNGATGPQGASGAQGLQGASGSAGINGSTGAQGASGSQGLTGASGPSSGYLNGPISGYALRIGATGSGLNWGATGSGWFGTGLFVGAEGSTGPAFGATGDIRATGNVTAYYTSDISVKENIRDIPEALQKVLSIGGKLYDWKDSYLEGRGGIHDYFLPKEDFGVIAQDVQAVFPVAVRTKADGTLAVDYEKLCALAFAAIKELNDKIEDR